MMLPRSWRLAATVLHLHLAVVSSLATRRREELAACSCDCCEVQSRREDTKQFQCAYSQMALFQSSASRCDSLCRQEARDDVLTTAQAPEMDTERFCFFECE